MATRQHSERSASADERYVAGDEPTAATAAKEQEAVATEPQDALTAEPMAMAPNLGAASPPPTTDEPVVAAPRQDAPKLPGMTRADLEAVVGPLTPPPPPAPDPDSVTRFKPMTQAEHVAAVGALPPVLPGQAPAPSGPIRKVAILGFTDSWRLAPFDDPDWEIWGLNELYMFVPRWTRWFELHEKALCMGYTGRTYDHLRKLAAMTCPVYMQQHFPEIPNSIPYPLQAVAQAFPNPGGDARLPYLTNSISYMLALSLIEGFQEVMVCGVDMAHDCLAPEMRVLTADLRWVPAGELKVGDELLAFDEEVPVTESGKPAQFRKYRKTTVESLSTINRPCYRLHMADGSTLVCSEGHQWLTLGGIKNARRWLRTDQLQGQDVYPRHATKIVKLTQVWDENRSWDAGYLAAALDGEGHLSQTQRDNCHSAHMALGFAQKPNAMSQQVMESMAQLGFRFGVASVGSGCDKYTIKGPRAEVLQFLGSVRPRRLMAKFDANLVGCLNSIDDTPVLRNEFIGERETVGIRTGTQTLIVEGFASHNSEYSHQRPSCEYFIGIAQGRGVKITLPAESELLLTTFLYGYQQEEIVRWHERLRARERDLENKVNQLDQQIGQASEARAQYRGALQDTQHLRKNWKGLLAS